MNPIIGHMKNARVEFDRKWDYPVGFAEYQLTYRDGVVVSIEPITDHDSGDEHTAIETTEPRKPNTMSEGAD